MIKKIIFLTLFLGSLKIASAQQSNVQVINEDSLIPPTAHFMISDSCLVSQNAIHFIADSIPETNYYWEFSDGTTSTNINPVHVFENYGYYCVNLEVSNACGTAHYSNVFYVLPDECACSQNRAYDIHDTIYTTNQTWDLTIFPSGEVFVEGDVFIQHGTDMNINDLIVMFGPRGRIIVDTAATLTILRSKLTSLGGSCNYMWQGIEVWGKHLESTVPSAGQGAVYLETNVTIENAHIGILAGKRDFDYICGQHYFSNMNPYDFEFTGGAIVLSDAQQNFINNGIDIKFDRKLGYFTDLMSKIIEADFDCTTLLDDRYNFSHPNHFPNMQNPWTGPSNKNQRTGMSIDIQTRWGIDIVSCNFNNKETCIRLIDAQVDVYAGVPGASVFTNARSGIVINNTLSGLYIPHKIRDCKFDEIPGNTLPGFGIAPTAIFISGGKYDKIFNNEIGNTYLPSYPEIYSGVFLTASSDHEVTENEFFMCEQGILSLNNNTGFIGAKAPNYAGNQFTKCKTSIITAWDNSNLTLRCNQHTPDNTGLVPYDDNWKNYGDLSDQGHPPFTCLNTRCPAGNRFHEPTQKDIYSTQYNSYFYWHHDPTVFPELKPDESANNIPNTIHIYDTHQPWMGSTISCQPIIAPNPLPTPLPEINFRRFPFSVLDSLQALKDSLQTRKENIIANLDHGETQLLLDALASNMPRMWLTNLLLTHSPLSDTVLITAITREQQFPPIMFTLIMMKNLPVSSSVEFYYRLKYQTLPYHFKQILNYIESNPVVETPALIGNKIAEKERLKLDFTRRLVNILCDTIHNRQDDALLLLEHEGSLNSIKTIIASHIENRNYAQASAELALIPQNTEENIDFVYINQTLLTLYQQGKTLYQLDSLDKEQIKTLAYKCPPSLAVANARTITELLFGEIVPECPYDMEAKNMKLPNDVFTNDYYFAKDDENAMLGENYPDPFGVNTKIPYSIPESITAKIIIHDIQGKIIKVYENISGENEIEFNGEKMAKGTYLYSLIIDDMVFETKKMVK